MTEEDEELDAAESQPALEAEAYAFAQRFAHLAPNEEGLQDFAHEIYLRVLRILRESPGATDSLGISNIQAYCRRIALNLKTDIMRSRHLNRTQQLPSDIPAEETSICSLEKADFVAQAVGDLQRLSDEDQELLQLALDGNRIVDIVKMCAANGRQVHYDRIASRLKRLRLKLRNLFHRRRDA